MKLNKLGFARKWQHPLLLFSGVLPVAVMLGVHNMPGCEYVPMLPLILYLFLGWLCLILPGEKRLAMGMVCCVGLVAVSHFLLPWWEHRALLLVPLAFYSPKEEAAEEVMEEKFKLEVSLWQTK